MPPPPPSAPLPTAPPPLTAAELERHVFARNPVAWFETHGRVDGKEVGRDPLLPPIANWLQQRVGEAVAWCLAERRPIRLILYKPRQQGCSTITVAIAYVLSRLVKMNVLVIGGQSSQTNNLWKILKHYGRADTHPWPNQWRITETQATLSNGSLWERETAGDREAGRSGNYHGVIATEVARWPSSGARDGAEVLNSVLNCVGDGPGTFVILESTAHGPHGPFPATWAGAASLEEARAGRPGNGYIRIFAPWHHFPRCQLPLEPGEHQHLMETIRQSGDEKALALAARLPLSPAQLKWYHHKLRAPECGGDPVRRDREYPTTEQDGFKASTPGRFDARALDHLEQEAARAAGDLIHGVLERDLTDKTFHHLRFRPTPPEEAHLCIAEPPRPGQRYLISTDNGRGRSHTEGGDTDPHAAIVLRAGHHDEHGAWHPPRVAAALVPGCRWDQDVLAEIVARLSAWYGRCIVVPEANRGELLIKELRDKGVPLWRRERRQQQEAAFEPTGLLGWETTAETKRYAIENLARHIREHSAPDAGLSIPIPWVVQECRTFTRHRDGTEGALRIAGCHDDFVIALAIALATQATATLLPRHPGPATRPEGLPKENTGPAVW